jgi:hypothetical protein
VNFWSIASHGTATVSTLIPLSSSKGATSSSKFAELSPITHTVTESDSVPASLLSGDELDEQAASPAPRVATVAMAIQRFFFIAVCPFGFYESRWCSGRRDEAREGRR